MPASMANPRPKINPEQVRGDARLCDQLVGCLGASCCGGGRWLMAVVADFFQFHGQQWPPRQLGMRGGVGLSSSCVLHRRCLGTGLIAAVVDPYNVL